MGSIFVTKSELDPYEPSSYRIWGGVQYDAFTTGDFGFLPVFSFDLEKSTKRPDLPVAFVWYLESSFFQ